MGKNNIQKFLPDFLATIEPADCGHTRLSDAEDVRVKLVGKKLANGDIKDAIRVLSSNDSILPQDPSTLATLQSKHPSRHPASEMPEPPDAASMNALQLSIEQIRKAILSFPGGTIFCCLSILKISSQKRVVKVACNCLLPSLSFATRC